MSKYEYRKQYFINKVMKFLEEDREESKSYLEWAFFNDYLEKNVRRYGLVKDFEENGIFSYKK